MMRILEIKLSANKFHRNQTIYDESTDSFPIPDGWAFLPESVGTPDTLENYPFGDITVADVDGIPTVTSWTPLPLPDPPPAPEELAYTDLQLLGQQVTEEELCRIEMGQDYTDLELAILGGAKNV